MLFFVHCPRSDQLDLQDLQANTFIGVSQMGVSAQIEFPEGRLPATRTVGNALIIGVTV